MMSDCCNFYGAQKTSFFYFFADTAGGYRNEEDIGESLKVLLPTYGLKRSDIFITSKLGW